MYTKEYQDLEDFFETFMMESYENAKQFLTSLNPNFPVPIAGFNHGKIGNERKCRAKKLLGMLELAKADENRREEVAKATIIANNRKTLVQWLERGLI